MKATLNFVRTFTVEFPVWVDGKPTDEKETRIKLLFVERTEYNGLPRTTYGSAVINKDWDEQRIHEVYKTDVDYSADLKMVAVEGSEFTKVVPR